MVHGIHSICTKKKSNSKIVQGGDGPVEIFKVYRVYTYISTPTAPMLSFPWGGLLALFHFRLTRCHCGEPRLRGEANEKLGKSVDAKTSMCFLIWVRKPTNQMFATKKHACRTNFEIYCHTAMFFGEGQH